MLITVISTDMFISSIKISKYKYMYKYKYK